MRGALVVLVLVACGGSAAEATADDDSPVADGGAEASSSSGQPGSGASSSSGASSPGDASSDAPVQPTCTLTASGPVAATADDQVIENLDIETDGSVAGITVEEHTGVVIRNVRIRHRGGEGISLVTADGTTIENVEIENTGAPETGANDSEEWVNLAIYESPGVHVTNAKLTRGATGIYLVESPDSALHGIEGHDFRGPFPRGQLVQWDKSNGGLLEDFSVENTAASWTEDNVNVYQSTGVTVRRGVVDGNNSPSGVGVIFDGETSTGTVEDVDALHMGNGCFSNIAGVDGNTFTRTRCRDNVCGDQGRGVPLSNALMWAGNEDHTNDHVADSVYFAACNPDNIAWPEEAFSTLQVTEQDFVPRAPQRLAFCWAD